ncbi:MAG: 50S ribosomal protein L4 [Candidatus Omnitrophica bacterium]|nr:50S ribosomal protein L4 [Candidatus Omnitrophota bacterium]
MELNVVDINGKTVETLTLKEAWWDGPVNTRLLAQAVHMYRTNQRACIASTKTRGDVSGGGKKPWKQKHTGRARAGSTRSPLWRHGGVVFGPHPRDVSYHLPKTMRRKALVESLKGKLKDQELVVIDRLQVTEPKTKPFGQLAKIFGVEHASVIVLEEFSDSLVKSLRNLRTFELRRADDLNAFDVLNAHKVLITTPAFQRVTQRLSRMRNGECGMRNEQTHE